MPIIKSQRGRIIALSNVFDDHYLQTRSESIYPSLSAAKRRDLFRCLELATEREVMVLSSPPKAVDRKASRWLPGIETRFSTHQQVFCPNWDAPKIRIPLSWAFYAAHVFKHTQPGDIVIIDNYELIYVIAAYAARLRRKLTFILEYEDGKHVIDHGLLRALSGTAEWLGRPLLSGALLTQPSLSKRLPTALPSELVPGFFRPPSQARVGPSSPSSIRFLYSGTLDKARGINLLLDTLSYLPAEGWELHVTGSGPLREQILAAARAPRWKGKFYYHGVLPEDEYQALIGRCDVALNCQSNSDPISGVTFPSKTFTYLSAGLGLISSTASDVREVLGEACWYYTEEKPEALAREMVESLENGRISPPVDALRKVEEQYSIPGTVERLQKFFEQFS